MYGSKQAAVFAYNNLKAKRLPTIYAPTVGIWQHATRQTKLCLCVDNFGITYYNKDYANYLLQAIGNHYKYTNDWDRKNYHGLTFNW